MGDHSRFTYAILTTAKDEESYIESTLASVCAQTCKPLQWVIIDDHSMDSTSEIIQGYAEKHSWIKWIRLENFQSGIKTTGGRVSYLLNYARESLDVSADVLVKLDADTKFENDFFAKLLGVLFDQQEVGIVSGWLRFNGKPEPIKEPRQTTRGAVMVIRSSILNETNGFFQSKGRGEDRLLAVAARSLGFQTITVPEYFDHLKPESSRHSAYHEAWNTGFYKGSIPYLTLYFLLTQVKHLRRNPIIIGSIVQIVGYLYSRFIVGYRPFPDFVTSQVQKEQTSALNAIFRLT